jgi:uncharacterized tellurite resistance protein B-like protein
MNTEELYLKTVFSCMACDGSIAYEEIQVLGNYVKGTPYFGNIDSQEVINRFVRDINIQGSSFLKNYLRELSDAHLDENGELTIIKLSLETIKADNHIDYSEVSFFKKIRSRLDVSDETILKNVEVEDLFLNQDIIDDEEVEFMPSFSEISITA